MTASFSSHRNNRHLSADFGLRRRDFMTLAAAGGLASALPSNAAWAQSPARGGHLKFGSSTGSSSDSLDPTTYLDWNSFINSAAICNYLTEMDAQKNLHPELATDWVSEEGATKFIFNLRKDVEFSTGKKLTAADVIYSLNLHRGPDTTSPAAPFLTSVTDIRSDGDHTLVFELSEPNADLPSALSFNPFAIVPEGHTDWSTLIGTGGYFLEMFEPGVRFGARRNPNYWKENRAWVDEFESFPILDSTARVNALLAGDVDLIDRAGPRVIRMIEERYDDFQIQPNPGSSYFSTAMDSRRSPYDNNDVRLALKYAVNRTELLDKIVDGYGVVGNDHPVAPNDPFYNAEIPQKAYDPDRALFHLRRAGMEGFEIELSAADTAFPGAVDGATLMRESAAAAGIDIRVIREPNDGYWSSVWMQKPFTMVAWSNLPTPSLQFDMAYACGAPWADGFLCHDRFESLLRESKSTTDFDRRKELFGEMQKIQSDEGANHVLIFDSSVNIAAPKIGGLVADALGPNMGMRIAERLWISG